MRLPKIIVPTLLTVATIINCPTHAQQNAAPLNAGFAIVELFTSEGCSSCPAADAVLEQVKKDFDSNVYILGFHVDYWNRLGWTDKYGSANYSKRQEQYLNALHTQSLYTPQVIINGYKDVVGSEKKELYSDIQKEINKKRTIDIKITAKKLNNNKLSISYNITQGLHQTLNIAIVQAEGYSDVRKGENAGKKLHHINIVRTFTSLPVASERGVCTIDIPSNEHKMPFTLIAYTQKATMQITGATKIELN